MLLACCHLNLKSQIVFIICSHQEILSGLPKFKVSVASYLAFLLLCLMGWGWGGSAALISHPPTLALAQLMANICSAGLTSMSPLQVQLFSEPKFQGSVHLLEDNMPELPDGFLPRSCKVLAGR